jgi:hypothetical protein
MLGFGFEVAQSTVSKYMVRPPLRFCHGRRQLLWFAVKRHPTAEPLTRRITEAFPWASAPGLSGPR